MISASLTGRARGVRLRQAAPSGFATLSPAIMAGEPDERDDRQGDLATEQKRKVEKVRRYKVVFHNDD